MNDVVTSTIVFNNFWSNIPAAGYVLFGLLISGIFNIITIYLTNSYNKKIKNIEHTNSRDMYLLNKKIEVFTNFNDSVSKLHFRKDLVNENDEVYRSILNSIHRVELFLPNNLDLLGKFQDSIVAMGNFYRSNGGVIKGNFDRTEINKIMRELKGVMCKNF